MGGWRSGKWRSRAGAGCCAVQPRSSLVHDLPTALNTQRKPAQPADGGGPGRLSTAHTANFCLHTHPLARTVTHTVLLIPTLRPLVLGKRSSPHGDEWCVASEDCAFGPIGFERVRDVLPGEMVIITEEGKLMSRQCIQVGVGGWGGTKY